MDLYKYNTLRAELESAAFAVGFAHGITPEEQGKSSPPEHAILWKSPYALLASIMVTDESTCGLTDAWRRAGEWMDALLLDHEKSNQFIDGYLVLALGAVPTGELAAAVRHLELDPSICRKQVLWPDRSGSWKSRVAAVTCLGLPEAVKDLTTLQEPELPQVAQQIFQHCAQRPRYEHIAEKLRIAAERNAIREKEKNENQ